MICVNFDKIERIIHIQIDETHKSARLLLDFLKTLDFVVVDDDVKANEWHKQKLDHLVEAKEKGELTFTSWEIARVKLTKKTQHVSE